MIAGHEKQGGNRPLHSNMQPFQSMVDTCNLIDLGFVGLKFTWSNLRQCQALIQECLDRSLCNRDWLNMFPTIQVHHLPRLRSDHHPLLMRLIEVGPSRRTSYFKVLAVWYEHPLFPLLVQGSWEAPSRGLLTLLTKFQHRAQSWNRNVFGNMFLQKKHYK